jgi:hypothetical protein
MPVFCLEVTYLHTGHTSVHTFPTAFDRALVMIALAAQPVRLRMLDYAHDGVANEVRALEALHAL